MVNMTIMGVQTIAWYKIFPKKLYYDFIFSLWDLIDVMHYYPVQQKEGFKYYFADFFLKRRGGGATAKTGIFGPFSSILALFGPFLTWVNFFWDQIGNQKNGHKNPQKGGGGVGEPPLTEKIAK